MLAAKPSPTPMRLVRSSLLSLVLATAGWLNAAPVASRVSSVTVYADRAVVTRTATVALPAGLAEVEFADLPEGLDERSLQLSGRGAAEATLLDVSARRTFLENAPDPRVRELEETVQALERQTKTLEGRDDLLESEVGTVAQIQAALLAPPAKDVPRPALDQLTAAMNFLREERTRLQVAHEAFEAEKQSLAARLAATRQQLAALNSRGGRSTTTVTARLTAATPGELTLDLAYAVRGARWTPGYDARVGADGRTVELAYFGQVAQSTGEDWSDAALTLSTARPALGGAAPELKPWELEVFLPKPVMPAGAFANREPAVRLEAFEVTGIGKKNGLATAAESDLRRQKDADLAQATVEAGATSASFRVELPVSVPSDGSTRRVPITVVALAAEPEYHATPKRQAAAFLTSKVTNTSEFPLLAGAMNVFLDRTLVATSHLRTVMPGEQFELALGVDEGIAVKHRRVQVFTEDTGLTNAGRRVTHEYLLTVQNHRSAPVRVVVTDQLPLARHEKITVKQLAPTAAQLKPTDEGLLRWTLDLAPGEKRELPVKFAIEHPKELEVRGLE